MDVLTKQNNHRVPPTPSFPNSPSTVIPACAATPSFPHVPPPRHSRMLLAGIHCDLGFGGLGDEGQGGFPITPSGMTVLGVIREWCRHPSFPPSFPHVPPPCHSRLPPREWQYRGNSGMAARSWFHANHSRLSIDLGYPHRQVNGLDVLGQCAAGNAVNACFGNGAQSGGVDVA